MSGEGSPSSPVCAATNGESSLELAATATEADVEQWVVLAQDGHAQQVLDATGSPDAFTGLPAAGRARLLYARALAHVMLGATEAATKTAVQLSAFCRDHGLPAQDLLARALLVELYRREGRLEEAVEQLARAVAQEGGLADVSDRQVQAALGALAVALRTFGVAEEARRVDERLSEVEAMLPLHQRVSRWSNVAIEHAIAAMAARRVPPFTCDQALLDRARAEIGKAVALADGGSYAVVADEARVIDALALAVSGDPQEALERLGEADGVLERGAEAIPARLLWAAARVHTLVRLGCPEEAVATGREHLSSIPGSGEAGDRGVLAYEALRAEHPEVEDAGTGAGAALALSELRARNDGALIRALFRARVHLWREVGERRSLARRASLDSLTGLLNRRGAAGPLQNACARPAGIPVAVLLVDLDDFGALNDACGHLAGDVVLQHVATSLRDLLDGQDVLARWGGDAFLLVAERDADGALALADAVRERVREAAEPGSADAVTASIGVALRTAPVEEADLVARAELALFTAQRAGGDTVAAC